MSVAIFVFQVRMPVKYYQPEGQFVDHRGRANKLGGSQKDRKPKLNRQMEEDLIAENQRLRAENDYLKNLNALVSKRV